MGADAWMYWVPYQKDMEAALEKLRQEVFQSGQFAGSELQPASIEEAIANTGPDGTGSVLDMVCGIADEPGMATVCPLSDAALEDYFGTTRPTRQQVEANEDFFEDINRGEGIAIITYKDGQPSEICFAGYSFD